MEMHPWGSCCPLGWPTPLEVDVGGVEAWVSMPLGWPTPLEVEVGEVGRVEVWVGMGVGVGGVCFPTVAPLTPLHVMSVEPPLPPLRCVPDGVGSGCPSPV